jgi:hypothetical protein
LLIFIDRNQGAYLSLAAVITCIDHVHLGTDYHGPHDNYSPGWHSFPKAACRLIVAAEWPTIAHMGHIRFWDGAIGPTAEMQAMRYLAYLESRMKQLPKSEAHYSLLSLDDMQAAWESENAGREKSYNHLWLSPAPLRREYLLYATTFSKRPYMIDSDYGVETGSIKVGMNGSQ